MRTGRRNLSPAVQWIVDVTRELLYNPIPYVKALTMGSVGLKVTSLKWTGPDPEGSEAPPKIPEQIEYRDRMKREAEIERVDGENYPRILLSQGGTVMTPYLFQ